MPEVIYSGPDGRLEGRIHTVEGRRSPVALILHPLPQFGGNMNNPIIIEKRNILKRYILGCVKFLVIGVSVINICPLIL